MAPNLSEKYNQACKEIATRLIHGEEDLDRIKREVSRKYGLASLPRNSDILKIIPPEKKKKFQKILVLKPVRTISGVAVVSVMTSPSRCPHGKCIPCPGGVEFSTPQSYVGHEPAALRGKQHDFNPFNQVYHRLKQLQEIGHPIDKVELIVMGGTFTSRTLCYQEWFVKECFNAMNYLSGLKEEIILEKAQIKNEKARIRNVGITFETRPDWARPFHIETMLRLGGTKVELGVQAVYDFILKRIERGHTVDDVVNATRLLKDAGFKVGYHMMPGLPGSNKKRDIRMFRKIFTQDAFKPDYLKIYPTLVVKGTRLYEMWKKGEYIPYTTEEAVDLIAEIKTFVPEYVRIQRIQRDIPVRFVEAGTKKSNIRQLVFEKLEREGKKCRCIRCREVGHKMLKNQDIGESIDIKISQYSASGGNEYFISAVYDEKDVLFGFTRLRIPGEVFSSELKSSGIVRELHVYGPMVPIGKQPLTEWQHRGIGERLLREAENITLENGCKNLAVISGVGVRDYYRNMGYRKKRYYMVKKL